MKTLTSMLDQKYRIPNKKKQIKGHLCFARGSVKSIQWNIDYAIAVVCDDGHHTNDAIMQSHREILRLSQMLATELDIFEKVILATFKHNENDKT